MASFEEFSHLPIELRQTIWKFRLSDEDEPEVCVVTYLSRDIVYTAFSVLMHVCQDSRHFVQNSKASGIEFRFSEAKCAVPIRKFDPKLDAVYCHNWATLKLLRHEDSMPVGQMRHLTIPYCEKLLSSIATAMVNDVRFESLSSLSVVLFVKKDGDAVSYNIQRPRRRCKLRRLQYRAGWFGPIVKVFHKSAAGNTGLLGSCLATFDYSVWKKLVTNSAEYIARVAVAGGEVAEARSKHYERFPGFPVASHQFLE
ncbi:hypothetical protein CaCOL14_008550 [Colletotrichum acutatum]|uniref:2EXR domain-containing protein n=1 Tax=Glomerella acutata TaxID=27357 RepID=A0AAD9CYW7_GLOAC|nr:uncharacterized protein BDZ83DRAFT_789344 [Colletotrichum acutatum]KAK1728993.1 hypothetical protein BDZ83DRAFT_789344 [Colletotrichum acutatum]